jgi:hypothetical protein
VATPAFRTSGPRVPTRADLAGYRPAAVNRSQVFFVVHPTPPMLAQGL